MIMIAAVCSECNPTVQVDAERARAAAAEVERKRVEHERWMAAAQAEFERTF